MNNFSQSNYYFNSSRKKLLNLIKRVVFFVKSSKIEMEKTFFKIWKSSEKHSFKERLNII